MKLKKLLGSRLSGRNTEAVDVLNVSFHGEIVCTKMFPQYYLARQSHVPEIETLLKFALSSHAPVTIRNPPV